MRYAENSSLKKNLQNIVKNTWIDKLFKLKDIISGLNTIHQKQLIHCDFHHGNILNQNYFMFISDLGLCKPVEYYQHFKKDDIYGVLPFVAPEVLRGEPYTLASDIYSFSMIMWEFTSGILPFDDKEHGLQLALGICKGERPEIIENTPQCYMELMKGCWDEDPLKRPNASEICKIIKNWHDIIGKVDKKLENNDVDIAMEFWQAEKKQINIFKSINDKLITKSHSQAYHTSHLLDFTKQINQILDKEEKEILTAHTEGLDCVIID